MTHVRSASTLWSLIMLAWPGAGPAQPECQETLESAWDQGYSRISMSYHLKGGGAPRWLRDAVDKWNDACKDSPSPSLTAGAAGIKTWSVLTNVPLPAGACGEAVASKLEIRLAPPNHPNCNDPVPTVLLHEIGHTLGLGHDGNNCPVSVMAAHDEDGRLPFRVNDNNCAAVAKFRRENTDRNPGGVGPGDGDGDPGGGTNPGRGTDPISRCADNPDECVETEEPKVCSWNSQTNTLTCNYF